MKNMYIYMYIYLKKIGKKSDPKLVTVIIYRHAILFVISYYPIRPLS